MLYTYNTYIYMYIYILYLNGVSTVGIFRVILFGGVLQGQTFFCHFGFNNDIREGWVGVTRVFFPMIFSGAFGKFQLQSGGLEECLWGCQDFDPSGMPGRKIPSNVKQNMERPEQKQNRNRPETEVFQRVQVLIKVWKFFFLRRFLM